MFKLVPKVTAQEDKNREPVVEEDASIFEYPSAGLFIYEFSTKNIKNVSKKEQLRESKSTRIDAIIIQIKL